MSELATLQDRYQGARSRLWNGVSVRPRRLVLPPAATPSVRAKPEQEAPFNFLKAPGPQAIIKLVALKYDVSAEALIGTSRVLRIVTARHAAMWLIHTHCRWISTPELGRLFNRDHTTVLNAFKKFSERPSKATRLCPCCGHSMPEPPDAEALKSLPLGGSEARLLGYYVDAYPKQMTTEQAIAHLWQLDPGGGPLAPSAGITIRVHNINVALKPYGWAIRRHGNSSRRLVRLSE